MRIDTRNQFEEARISPPRKVYHDPDMQLQCSVCAEEIVEDIIINLQGSATSENSTATPGVRAVCERGIRTKSLRVCRRRHKSDPLWTDQMYHRFKWLDWLGSHLYCYRADKMVRLATNFFNIHRILHYGCLN